jgi:hypothetical protein
MEGAEQRGIAYVFKLKQSAHVKRLIAKLFGHDRWVDAWRCYPRILPRRINRDLRGESFPTDADTGLGSLG